MSTTTDEQGRLYLSKGLRDRYGERFHIIEYPDRIELVPIDEDPLEGLRAAVGDAFEDEAVDDLRAAAREQGRKEALEDVGPQ